MVLTSKKARAIATALTAIAAFLLADASQPHWAHELEGIALVLGASFGIKPPHLE